MLPPIHTRIALSPHTTTVTIAWPHSHPTSAHYSNYWPPARQRLLYLGLTRLTLGKLFVDEDTNEKEGQCADDTEDEDDTRFFSSPILALDQFVNGVLTASDEGGINCNHFAFSGSKSCAERLVSWLERFRRDGRRGDEGNTG